jgi:hypothetical protein
MTPLKRITRDPTVMSGKPCIRGLRVTVGTVVGLLAAGRTPDEVLNAILAETDATAPSVIQVRVQDLLAAETAIPIAGAAATAAPALGRGAIVTIHEDRSRIRILPLRVRTSNQERVGRTPREAVPLPAFASSNIGRAPPDTATIAPYPSTGPAPKPMSGAGVSPATEAANSAA